MVKREACIAMDMIPKVLIVGAGGREHAMAWKMASSPMVEEIFVAPGNAGIADENKVTVVACPVDDVEGLCRLALERAVDLVVVGPELPLALALVDRLRCHNVPTVGPCQAAARLESSKVFSKSCMQRYGVPSARHHVFTQLNEALAYLKSRETYPVVIKADELAAGKGVIVAATAAEASAAAAALFSGEHCGLVSRQVIVEDFLSGEELSFICLVDEKSIIPLACSRDYKARDEGGKGPNTGGMGAYSSAALIDQSLHHRIVHTIIEPIVAGLRQENIFYTGFLYAGLMIAADGAPYVLEFNCRLGDPETQVILPRLQSDFAELCYLAACNRLAEARLHWDERVALTVVMASRGYPDKNYATGRAISGLDQKSDAVKVFHAGSRYVNGQIQTAGGRVLSVTALGETMEVAQRRAYSHCKKINWQGCFYRSDIGAT